MGTSCPSFCVAAAARCVLACPVNRPPTQNIISYLDTIVHVLKDDGLWVNHGPLQWHSDTSIQLSLDELMEVLGDYDLVVTESTTSLTYYSSYRTEETSMRPDLYQPVLFVARKRRVCDVD